MTLHEILTAAFETAGSYASGAIDMLRLQGRQRTIQADYAYGKSLYKVTIRDLFYKEAESFIRNPEYLRIRTPTLEAEVRDFWVIRYATLRPEDEEARQVLGLKKISMDRIDKRKALRLAGKYDMIMGEKDKTLHTRDGIAAISIDIEPREAMFRPLDDRRLQRLEKYINLREIQHITRIDYEGKSIEGLIPIDS